MARTSAAPASRSTRAHASSVAPVVSTSSTSTSVRPSIRRPGAAGSARHPSAEREGVADVGLTRVAIQRRLRRRRAPAMKDLPHRAAQRRGQQVGLVVAASPLTPRMQRDGHDGIGVVEQIAGGLVKQWAQSSRQRPTALELQPVDDVAQYILERADRAHVRERRRKRPEIAGRRCEAPDARPARVAHRRPRRRIKHPRARDARRRKDRRDQRISDRCHRST